MRLNRRLLGGLYFMKEMGESEAPPWLSERLPFSRLGVITHDGGAVGVQHVEHVADIAHGVQRRNPKHALVPPSWCVIRGDCTDDKVLWI